MSSLITSFIWWIRYAFLPIIVIILAKRFLFTFLLFTRIFLFRIITWWYLLSWRFLSMIRFSLLPFINNTLAHFSPWSSRFYLFWTLYFVSFFCFNCLLWFFLIFNLHIYFLAIQFFLLFRKIKSSFMVFNSDFISLLIL